MFFICPITEGPLIATPASKYYLKLIGTISNRCSTLSSFQSQIIQKPYRPAVMLWSNRLLNDCMSKHFSNVDTEITYYTNDHYWHTVLRHSNITIHTARLHSYLSSKGDMNNPTTLFPPLQAPTSHKYHRLKISASSASFEIWATQ